MRKTLLMLTALAVGFWLLAPKPETLIEIMAVCWVLYVMLYGFLWLCGKFVMRAVNQGIKDGTLKFTLKETEKKGKG